MDVTIGQGYYSSMGQCSTLDADVTIGCYYGDYSSCDNIIPMSVFIWIFFAHTCLPPLLNLKLLYS